MQEKHNMKIWRPSEIERMRLELRREIFQCRSGTEEAHTWLADRLDTSEEDNADNGNDDDDDDDDDVKVVQ